MFISIFFFQLINYIRNPVAEATTVSHSHSRMISKSQSEAGTLCLDVSLLEEEEDAHLDTGDEDSVKGANINIIVSGPLPPKDALWNYFDDERRSGGGEVLEMYYTDEGDAVITFAEVKGKKNVVRKVNVPFDALIYYLY